MSPEKDRMKSEEQASAGGKRRKRPIIWRRVLFYPVFTVILSLLCIDAWFETRGVPRHVHDYIEKKLNEKGIIFAAKKIKIGFLQGLVLSDVEVKDGELSNFTLLNAERITIDFSLVDIFLRQRFNLSDFTIANGSLALPVFPESGEEGMGDILRISDIHARLRAEDRELRIDFLKGKIGKIDVGLSGRASNLLPSIYGVPAAGVAAYNVKGFSPLPMIRKSSLETRIRIVKLLDRFRDENFSESPSCLMEFDLDARNINKSSLRAAFNIPAFSYGHLKVKHVKGSLRFDNNLAELTNLRVELADSEFCEGNGRFNASTNSVSGTFKGATTPEKLLLFMDENTQKQIRDNVSLPSIPINYQGKLENYGLDSGRYEGMLELVIPGLTIHGLEISGLKASLLLNNDGIEATALSAKLPNNDSVKGDFLLSKNSFSCNFEGSTKAALLSQFLNETASKFLEENVSIRKETPVLFKGNVALPSFKEEVRSGELKVQIPSLMIRGLDLKNFSANVAFTERFIKAREFDATLSDGTRLNGDIICIPSEQVVSASLFCTGSPQQVISLLEKDHKALLDSFLSEIVWPDQKSLAEAALDIHCDWGEKPSYMLSGDIVLSNFSYRGIKFDYGASKFHIDSDGLIIIPGVVVQSPDGQALLAASYDGRNSSPASDSGQTPFLSAFDTPRGRLSFTVDSSLSPQNLLVSLYPPWKEQALVFDGSSELKARGVVNYVQPEKSWYNANIRRGSAAWNGIPLRKLDADISYREQEFKISNASADICGGNAEITYEYRFDKSAGKISFKVDEASLPEVLKAAQWDKFKGLKRGELSVKLNADISYDKKDNLLLNGEGNMLLENSDIWAVPFFGDMLTMIGQAWSIDKYGEVSKLKCDFTLDGDRLSTKSISSDGSIIALKGDGYYSWVEKEYSFNVRAEPLKDALPFKMAPVLLTPVSWLFEARVHGKNNEVKWEQNSSLKKLFRDKN